MAAAGGVPIARLRGAPLLGAVSWASLPSQADRECQQRGTARGAGRALASLPAARRQRFAITSDTTGHYQLDKVMGKMGRNRDCA